MARQPEPISRIEKISVDKRNRMNEIEAAYLRAKEYEKGSQFTADKLAALEKVRSILRLGAVTEPEALLMIGRLQQVILDTFAQDNVVIEYEGIKKRSEKHKF